MGTWDQREHGTTFLALTLVSRQACLHLELITKGLGITGSDPTRAARKVARRLVFPNAVAINNAKASISSMASAC